VLCAGPPIVYSQKGIKYNSIRTDLRFKNEGPIMLFLPKERIFSNPAGFEGDPWINGDSFLITGENDQFKKVISSLGDSCEIQTYVKRKGSEVFFPEESPDPFLYYYRVINVKKWYVRLLLKTLIMAGLKRYIYTFLAPNYVMVVFKKGNSAT
jgi:hypothetical protein